MELLLTHSTALEAYRSTGLRALLAKGEVCPDAVPSCLPAPERLSQLRRYLEFYGFCPKVMEALVSGVGGRRRSSSLRTRVCGRPLPTGSIMVIGEGVACVAPEHLAVQMAPLLTKLELQVLLCELLGVYAIVPSISDGMLQRNSPLMAKESIERHIDRLNRIDGIDLVRQALPATVEGLASPMETRLCLRTVLSPCYGGYGMEIDAANRPLDVDAVGKRGSRKVRKPDFVFGALPGSRAKARFVALEYNGNDHLTRERQAEDERRTNEILAYGGIEYQLNKELYDDLEYMDALMRTIADDIGRPCYRMTEERKRKRRALRLTLKEELDRIDGVTWGGRKRGDYRKVATEEPLDAVELVPVDAYGV